MEIVKKLQQKDAIGEGVLLKNPNFLFFSNTSMDSIKYKKYINDECIPLEKVKTLIGESKCVF